MVSRDEIPDKPALIVRASTRSDHALSALQEVLRTMSLKLKPEIGYSVHLLGKAAERMDDVLAAPEARDAMHRTLEEFRNWILAGQQS
jgi:hypothetical protein